VDAKTTITTKYLEKTNFIKNFIHRPGCPPLPTLARPTGGGEPTYGGGAMVWRWPVEGELVTPLLILCMSWNKEREK
jgi:hypothetical protein